MKIWKRMMSRKQTEWIELYCDQLYTNLRTKSGIDLS